MLCADGFPRWLAIRCLCNRLRNLTNFCRLNKHSKRNSVIKKNQKTNYYCTFIQTFWKDSSKNQCQIKTISHVCLSYGWITLHVSLCGHSSVKECLKTVCKPLPLDLVSNGIKSVGVFFIIIFLHIFNFFRTFWNQISPWANCPSSLWKPWSVKNKKKKKKNDKRNKIKEIHEKSKL